MTGLHAHNGLTREDILRHPPGRIALMVASEFWRAAGKAEYPAIVQASFSRAKELMGILETIDLNPTATAALQTCYRQCIDRELEMLMRSSPTNIRLFCERLAQTFEQAFANGEGDQHA